MEKLFDSAKKHILTFLNETFDLEVSESTLTIIFYSLLILGTSVLIPLFKKVRAWYSYKRVTQRQNPYYQPYEFRDAYRFYVHTKFQNIPPSYEEEPYFSQASVARQKLIPFFLRTFSNDRNKHKYYIILADSGMGKTTFMMNLYMRYKRRLFKHFDMYIFPLSQPDIEKDIENISDEQMCKSIILLDAFDEDLNAARDYMNRIEELVKLTSKFRFVVISSRTQFFPIEEVEPGEIRIRKHGSVGGFHTFKKIYLSPFNDSDIRKFLLKRYPIYRVNKITRAFRLTRDCPYLMVRPMLLNYIDDLLDHQDSFNSIYNIYSLLIESWIDREANRKRQVERAIFKQNLYEFSEKFAVELYNNFYAESSLRVPAQSVITFAQESNINLSDLELKSKSLLNRDGRGNYKFAHKSILEFFLAKIAFSKHFFLREFNFSSFTFARQMYRDLCKINYDQNKSNLSYRLDSKSHGEFIGNKMGVLTPSTDFLQHVSGVVHNRVLSLIQFDLTDDYLHFIKMMTEVVVLNLSSNRLTNLETLNALTGICDLYLRDNTIITFSLRSFPKLTVCDLSYNALESFHIDSSSIEELDLSFNPITRLTFSDVSNLRILNLSNTQLNEVPQLPKSVHIIKDNEFDLLLNDSRSKVIKSRRVKLEMELKTLAFGVFNKCTHAHDHIVYYRVRIDGVKKQSDYDGRFDYADGLDHNNLLAIFKILPLVETKNHKPQLDDMNFVKKLSEGIQLELDHPTFSLVRFGIKNESLCMHLMVR
ncbi:hypothetical protein [Marinoscillum sp. 108]|uniref:hypothetical protein n=1 Tax=Marinoscillum sp. 108 TaxID=2653151 RepID=UPI0012F3FF22|nr:hypothetical protein [Marinoscillum sp. 108]VXD13669.1 hypothetical protein MARINOS108_11589 [Marinoscillum sp. 108]